MSTTSEARAWVEIRADALAENYARIRRNVGPDVGMLPMVKADAYGLGVRAVVEVLDPLEPWGYGVATVTEGIGLRDLGVVRPVLVCSPTPPGEVGRAVASGLHLSVSSVAALDSIARAAEAMQSRASVHADVDTGMGRSGFDWRCAAEWLPALRAVDGDRVAWAGIHTHLHSADEGAESVHEQWRRFSRVLEAMDDLPPGLMVHALNSAGSFRAPEYGSGLVRPGIFLYGGAVGADQPAPAPVVSVRARVVHVRDAPPATTLGYGATHTASGRERWATLSIGYGDGLPRALGNRGSALIGGRRVPIIGRISMDVTVVDISDVPDVAVGDVATVLGSDGAEAITLDEVAGLAGTISYEVLTGLTPRLPRVWKGVPGSFHG